MVDNPNSERAFQRLKQAMREFRMRLEAKYGYANVKKWLE